MVHTKRLDSSTYMIDLTPKKFKDFISSYVIKSEKTAIIESGPTCSVEKLFLGLEEIGVAPQEVDYLLVSHIHLDHGGGSGELLQLLPKARLVVHPRGARHIANPEKLWFGAKKVLGEIADIYGEPKPVPEERIIKAHDGMILELGETRILVLETLGHASHHLSFYEPPSKRVFSGDAAGVYIPSLDAVVPTTPKPLHLDLALKAIHKMVKLNPETICYTHFGCADNAVEKLKSYAAQLKLWEGIVRESMARGEKPEDIAEKIVSRDVYVSRVITSMGHNPIVGRRMLLQNIQGFVSYVEKRLAASLSGGKA